MTARFLAMLALLAAGPAAAQEPPAWDPVSTTAMAITGRVTLAPDRLTFANRATLPLEPTGEIPNFVADRLRVTATLYRVTEPANPVLLRGSRLCGVGRPVRQIVVWQTPPIGTLAPAQEWSLAAFSSADPPKGTDDPGLCGTFLYELPRVRTRR
ncbi:MAG: hypothetical protein ACOYOH_16920 [Paracraurococcus sp.]